MNVPSWDKVTSCEKFSHSHTLESQIVWKSSALQCYWWNYQNAEMYLNFKNFQLKWTVLKHFFKRPKQWAAFRKLFSPPPDKSFFRRYTGLLTEIYRNIHTFASPVFRECSSWASRNGAVQFFFLYQPEACLLENV